MVSNMKTLGEALPEECARVRKIMATYLTFPGGQLAAAMMEASLKLADQAMVSGDVVAMMRCYEDLKGYEL
jgi:hypothetical protein